VTDSAVSWAAIIAGALAAAAITVMLFALGTAFGLSIVSPWWGAGASPTTFAISTAVWFIIVQWISSAVGGYLVGRLRTRWTGIHSDEVFFRDSAHGFLAWSLATLVVVALLASSAAAVIGGTAKIAGEGLSAGAQGAASVVTESATQADQFSTTYLVDLLFRPGPTSDGAAPTAAPPSTSPAEATPAPTESTPSVGTAGEAPRTESESDSRAEIGRLLARGVTGEISEDDRIYLAQTIATRTGIPQAEAETRVNQIVATIEDTKVRVQEATDQARKAGAAAAGLSFLSLLIGAFIACVAAIVGGNQRDGLAPWRIRPEVV
jgi:hypothetical protein